MRLILAAFLLLSLAACAPPNAAPGAATAAEARTEARKTAAEGLAAAITRLSPEIDRLEAAEAARLAYARTEELRVAYRITDPPLVHNTLVNLGLKPRGLCWHWADDLEATLAAAGFETLTLHRAIANADTPFRIDHSTVILSAAGASMEDGLVLDPWRQGGTLTWVPTRADPDYRWVSRASVFAWRARRAAGG